MRRNRLLLVMAFATAIALMGAPEAEAQGGCVRCDAGDCELADASESGNCECAIRCGRFNVCMCRPVGVCEATLGCQDGPMPMAVARPSDNGPCQSRADQSSMKTPIAVVADSAALDLVARRSRFLATLIDGLDLVEESFQGNMGWRSPETGQRIPGPSFSGFLERAADGKVRLSVTFRTEDEVTEYEMVMSNDLLSGDLIEKRGDQAVHFIWNPEDVAMERARRPLEAQ